MKQDPPEITKVETHTVWCDGSGDIRGGPNIRPAALGHPRVFYQIDEKGFVDCGYCDRRFILMGGPADESAEADGNRPHDELSPGHLPEPAPGGAPGEGLGGHDRLGGQSGTHLA